MSERFPSTVTLDNVSRAYGRTFALHRATLRLDSGSVTAVVGNNGAGKSTLLNLLATTDQPTSGTLQYDTLTPRQVTRQARHCIGWVSHESLLYEELTARENLLFYARMYGLSSPADKADRWLARVGLDRVAHRQARHLSRGMTQRLTIARALIHGPQLILFDEPATGLDQQGQDFVADLLAELRQRQRIILLVSHNFEFIDGLADRVAILRRGQITYDAPLPEQTTLTQIYRDYA